MVIRTISISSSAFLVVASIAIAIVESQLSKVQISDPPNNEDSTSISDIYLNDQLLESDILNSKFGIQRTKALHSLSSNREFDDLKTQVRKKRQFHSPREKRQGLLPSEEENGESLHCFKITESNRVKYHLLAGLITGSYAYKCPLSEEF